MPAPIIPRLYRGCLFFEIGPALFPTFKQAATAWSAAESHRLGIADEVETLVVQRTAALAEMRAAGQDMARFNAACKSEAELAVRIRQLRAQTGQSADNGSVSHPIVVLPHEAIERLHPGFTAMMNQLSDNERWSVIDRLNSLALEFHIRRCGRTDGSEVSHGC